MYGLANPKSTSSEKATSQKNFQKENPRKSENNHLAAVGMAMPTTVDFCAVICYNTFTDTSQKNGTSRRFRYA